MVIGHYTCSHWLLLLPFDVRECPVVYTVSESHIEHYETVDVYTCLSEKCPNADGKICVENPKIFTFKLRNTFFFLKRIQFIRMKQVKLVKVEIKRRLRFESTRFKL